VDRDRWGHSTTSLSQANAKFPGMVVWDANYDHGKRELDFD
jgi:hypothetical protein